MKTGWVYQLLVIGAVLTTTSFGVVIGALLRLVIGVLVNWLLVPF